MARIVLTTIGSRGDINPFIALACGLRERGHAVHFAVDERFAALVAHEGFAADVLPPDMLQDHTATGGAVGPIKRAFEHGVLPTMPAKIAALHASCQHADLLVSSGLHIAASIVGEVARIPWASLVLPPLCIPSTEFAPIPQPRFGWSLSRRASNVIAWAVGATLLRQIVDADVQALRRSYGLSPRPNVLLTGSLAPGCTAVAISPAFLPRPSDWLPTVHLTGFCFWDTPTGWQPSPKLAAFLQDNVPVVAVSSGSTSPTVASADPSFYHISIEAIRQAGARAIVIGAAPGVLPDPLPPHVHAEREVPFSYVYPRCVAVIHHGGIGTIAQAMRAGVPMLVVPWGFDQFFNAARVAELGLGMWMVRRWYTTKHAATALQRLLSIPAYHQRVQAAACALAAEDGVAQACQILEAFLARE